MRSFAQRHPLVTFFALAYAISWSYWIPLALTGHTVAPGSTTTHFPGLLGPGIAAFLTLFIAGDRAGIRNLRQQLFRVSRPSSRFWVYSLSPLAFLAAALVIASITGATIPPVRDFASYSGLPELGLVVVFLLVILGNGYGEETGWRGFALPRLQSRFGPLGGPLVLAALWAGWHIPAFAIVETYQAMSVGTIIGGFILGLTCGSIVLARVSHQTGGSVLGVALWHAIYNMTSATAASRGLIGAVTTTCVMVWAAWLLFTSLRSHRASTLLQVPARV